MTLLLERLQVVIHPVGRANIEVLSDLAKRRRKAALEDRGGDEVENLPLSLGQRVRHWPLPSGSEFYLLNGNTVLNAQSPCQFFSIQFEEIAASPEAIPSTGVALPTWAG